MRPPANPPAPRNTLPADALRVFFALWPDAGARHALAGLARDIAARTEGRAPPAQNLHLTLAFLGDVAVKRVAALSAIGGAAASNVPPFKLTLDRTGSFRRSGITWAGASMTPPAIEQLVQQLGDALAADGFPTERHAFEPHVTLARRCRTPVDARLVVPIVWTVARLALNASELRSGGPCYRELASWPFGMQGAEDC